MEESTKQRSFLSLTHSGEREKEREREKEMKIERDDRYFSSLPIKLKFINSKCLYIILQCVLAKKVDIS